MRSALVESERTGRVALVRLRDPSRSNALTPAMVGELRAAFADLGDARAVLVCAAGRNFCSGGDHESFLELSLDDRRQYLRDTKALFREVGECSVPTVACLQGAVVGGGVELALQCDLLVAGDDAQFHLPHVALRTRLAQGTYVALVARTGLGFARRLVLLGQRVDAQEALAAGLVDVVRSRPTIEAARWRSPPSSPLSRPRASAQHGGRWRPRRTRARRRRAVRRQVPSQQNDIRRGAFEQGGATCRC
jgi:enoyl-CoA hydratase/carnithine racemase